MSGHESDSSDGSTENKVLHTVDGIEEYDNKLPNWWLYTLYGSIVFAIGYWFVYQSAGIGELPRAAYEAEMDRAAQAQAGAAKLVPVTAEALAALAKDRGAVARGKQVFTTTCAACHRADGGGVVGPNLTDEFWLHGASPDKVYKTIKDGVLDKGMPAWGPQLGPERVQAVTAYVLTLRGTNVPGGKVAQGERETLTINP
jgi:cytochrome c oxidase cbb3-type subunit 3